MADDGEKEEGQGLTESTAEQRERIYQQQVAFRKAQEEASRRVIDGVGPDTPVVTNDQGGKQSDSPYRLDLVPPKALLATSAVLKEGMQKYGRDNWRKICCDDHLNHALVHIYSHLAGDQSDQHLAHAACRLLFALETQAAKEPPRRKVLPGSNVCECLCGAEFPVEAYVPGKCPGCGRRYGWSETPCMDWY